MELPKNLIRLYKNARESYENKEYDKSLKHLNEALNIEPNYAEAMILLVLVHSFLEFKKMSKDKALKVIERALSLKSESSFLWSDLGRFYSELKDEEKAIEYYHKSIEIDPQYKRAYANLGWIYTYSKLKDYEKAIKYLNNVIKIDPQYRNAYFNLGWIYTELKNYDKAIEYYNKSIEIDPQYTSAYSGLGSTYAELKDYEKAIECYNTLIEIDHNNKNAYANLAIIYGKNFNIPKFVEVSQKFFKLDPDFAGSFADLLEQNLPEKTQTSVEQDFQKIASLLNKPKSTVEKILKKYFASRILENWKQDFQSSEFFYRRFRSIQSRFIELAKESPNSVFFQKFSQLDLSNVLKIIPELLEILEEVEEVELKDTITHFYNIFKSREISSFIPWDILYKIKETTINLAVKYPRLQIQEIAEKCGSPLDCVIVVIREMIKNVEIYADYFESTRFVVFDQKINLDEIENIQNRFEVWEKTTCKKCGMKVKETNQKICEYCGLDL